MISAFAVPGLPEIEPGADLAAAILAALDQVPATAIGSGDVLVVAHKAISKSEGRVRSLVDVTPGPQARQIAAEQGRDPRHVQVVLDEARELIRVARGVMIVETRHGFVCANAGVDASNVPGDERLVLLPVDPDASPR